MRRLFLAVSLLTLTACGGELTAEEIQAPEATQSETSRTEAAVANCASPRECYCIQFTTPTTCSKATKYPCFWNDISASCEPIYF